MQTLRDRLALLLIELRTWDTSEPPRKSLDELCAQLDLDADIVEKVARSEGFELVDEPGTPIWVDPDKTTEPLDELTAPN